MSHPCVCVTLVLLGAAAGPAGRCAADAPAAPATMPLPLTEQEIVDRAAAAADELAAVERQTQQNLKALAKLPGPEADQARRDLLVRRRAVDRQAHLAERRLKVHWLGRSLSEARRAEINGLGDDDLDALLDARTVDQRLAVPLPPKKFENAPLRQVLEFVEAEADVRVLADWPALTRVGVARSDLVSFDVGRYARPAGEVLRLVLSAAAADQIVIDANHPDAVLVSTKDGLERLAEMDRLLAPRVRNPQAWANGRLAGTISLTGVPLAAALDTVLADVPAEVQADKLEAIGVTGELPVTLSLGVHRPGHAAAALADVLNAQLRGGGGAAGAGGPAAGGGAAAADGGRQLPPDGQGLPQGGVAFDLSADGVLILSTRRGLAESLAAADWLADAAANAPDLKPLLARRLPELTATAVPLADVVGFVREATGIDVRPDWRSLAASGLDKRTPVTLDLANAPAAQALRLMFAPPSGRPPVTWQAAGTTLVVRSAAGNAAPRR